MALAWPGIGAARRRQRSRAWSARLSHAAQRHSWIARAAEREAPAATTIETDFDALFAQYERQVYSYLWRVTGDQHLASDLCQETFLRAWQHFEKIRAYESPLGWLLRVATNLALNSRRRRDTRAGLPISLSEELAPAASDPAWRIAERDSVHTTLLALPANMRAALVLREVYGLSCEEVGRALGITHAAARMTLSRAREQFRQRYRREEGHQ